MHSTKEHIKQQENGVEGNEKGSVKVEVTSLESGSKKHAESSMDKRRRVGEQRFKSCNTVCNGSRTKATRREESFVVGSETYRCRESNKGGSVAKAKTTNLKKATVKEREQKQSWERSQSKKGTGKMNNSNS